MKQTEWCGVPIIINNATSDLFQMSEPDENPNQQPEFHITQSTADIVPLDFKRYQPSLQRMIETRREEKERLMRQKKRAGTEGPSAVQQSYD